ncbi:hypothetical protein, partial [Aquabacterium sp.]|uniref:hypothetical protein n=1 Tax=Aquabacterium sp. TaxID=1872578 RepID=UPI002C9457A6
MVRNLRLLRHSLPGLATAAALALPGPTAQAADEAPTWYLSGARILVAPDAAAVIDGVVLGRGGKIVAVGPKGALAIPADARELGCAGGVVAAG